MKPKAETLKSWRPVRHPLRICLRPGWRAGRGCLISPRGRVFALRQTRLGMFARLRTEFDLLSDHNLRDVPY